MPLRQERLYAINNRVGVLRTRPLASWTGDDLAFYNSYRDRFSTAYRTDRDAQAPWTQGQPPAAVDPSLGAVTPHPPALTRLRVEPRFGIAWIGIAGIVTVAGLAIYHGSRHEREARKAGR